MVNSGRRICGCFGTAVSLGPPARLPRQSRKIPRSWMAEHLLNRLPPEARSFRIAKIQFPRELRLRGSPKPGELEFQRPASLGNLVEFFGDWQHKPGVVGLKIGDDARPVRFCQQAYVMRLAFRQAVRAAIPFPQDSVIRTQ